MEVPLGLLWSCLALTLTVTSDVMGQLPEIKNCMPPSFELQGPKEMFFTINHIIDIPCIANGKKLHHTWLKNGKEIDPESAENKERMTIKPGTSTLVISQSQEDDAGVYQCVVTNDCGTALSLVTELSYATMEPFNILDKAETINGVLGYSKKLSCTPPFSVPKAQIAWILEDAAGTDSGTGDILSFNTVTLDDRVTMDYTGNLYITSMRQEDKQGGKTYVCMAHNAKTRSSNKGNDKVVQIKGTAMHKMGVTLMWHSDTDSTALQGHTARFKCIFSGQPLPEVTWRRVDHDLDERMETKHFELIIRDVQDKDQGYYECSGRNPLKGDVQTHRFHLTVDAAPEWTVQPSNLEVGVEESANIKCEARGKPKPKVEWFINGKPWNQVSPNPRRKLKDNVLFFTDLDQEDSQVVQCKASNDFGYAWSNVYLYVEAAAPSIRRGPELDLVSVEGQKVTLTCVVEGKPKPVVTWYKGGQVMDHPDMTTKPDGSLEFANVSKKDTGSYRCLAVNRYNTAEATGYMEVREKTNIFTAPVSQEVVFLNQVEFTCGATTDSQEMQTLKYHWLKDGEPLHQSDNIRITSNKLTILQTSSSDSGKYTCVAQTSYDNATATATLKVKAPPEPPYNVMSTCGVDRQATISWKFDPSMANFDTMLKYIVEYQTEYKPNVWMNGPTVPYPDEETQFEMSPFANYTFRVSAMNNMGISKSVLAQTPKCTTLKTVPFKCPDDVTTDERFTGFLIIKWKPMEAIELNGPDFSYRLEVREQGSKELHTFTIPDFRAKEYRIPVNTTYKAYLIDVWSQNQVGNASRAPTTVTGYSGEAAPTVVPSGFERDPDVNVTSTSAGFMWEPVDTSPEVIMGRFSGYKVRFWKMGEKETTMHKQIIQDSGRKRRASGDGKVRATVGNLPSYATIEADVVVINQYFESAGSNVVNFSTPEGIPSQVGYLVALQRGSHHFLLEWDQPKHKNGILRGYRLAYRNFNKLSLGEMVNVTDTLQPDETRFTLNGLSPDSDYRVYIWAWNDQGLGRWRYIDVRTTSNLFAIGTPVLKLMNLTENDVNITWTINIAADQGGRKGELYILEYRKAGGEWTALEEPITHEQMFYPPPEEIFWAHLDHLDPGTWYEVQVIAKAHKDGKAQTSSVMAFRTHGVGAASFLTAAWFIGMMVAIAILILILIIVCIIKRNRGDNYPVQEKERLRGNCEDNQDHFNGFGKGDENGIGGSSSFDRDAEKVPLDEDTDSMDYGDDDGSKFNEDGSFIGQYGRGEKANEAANASSIV